MAAAKKDDFVSLAEAVAASGYSRGSILRWLKEPGTDIRHEVASTSNGRGTRVCLSDVLRRAGVAEDDNELDVLEDDGKSRFHNELVKTITLSQRHIEMLLTPAKQFGEALAAENASLRARNSELEEKLAGMVDKYEAALSAEHERRMAEERDKREAKRLDDAIQKLFEFMPAAAAGLFGHLGLANAQEAVLVNAVARMTDAQLRAIMQSGLLDPSALAVIDRVRATRKTTNGSKAHDSERPPSGHAGADSQESRQAAQ
jgi:hypothetical protein